MTERLPDNLAGLYEAFGKDVIESINTGDVFVFDGVEFVCKYRPDSTADRFYILKAPHFVEFFVEFSAEFRGGTIFELGIAEGGSTALLSIVAEPDELVAVDLERNRLAALDEFLEQRGLVDRVKAHYGVDQADRQQLGEIATSEFGDRRLDWVIDDASHQLAPTRTSFETLFPRLRPGGVYTIEDWNAALTWQHAVVAAMRAGKAADTRSRGHRAPTSTPEKHSALSDLGVELLLAAALSSDAIASVTFNQYWIEIRRGPTRLDPDGFRLSDLYHDYFGYLPSNAD